MAIKRLLTRPPRQLGSKSDLLSHSRPAACLLPGQYLTSRGLVYWTKRLVYWTPRFKVLRAILKCWKARSGTPPTLTNPRKRPLRLRGIVSSETSSEPPDAKLLEGQERYICVYTLEAKWTPCLNAPTPTVLNFAQPGWKAKRYAFNLKKFGPHLPSMRIIVLKL